MRTKIHAGKPLHSEFLSVHFYSFYHAPRINGQSEQSFIVGSGAVGFVKLFHVSLNEKLKAGKTRNRTSCKNLKVLTTA